MHVLKDRRSVLAHSSLILPALFLAISLSALFQFFVFSPSASILVSKTEFVASRTRTDEQPNAPNHHVVFSTSCSPQQDWESMVFFFHAKKVRQPGNVTRIISGCSDDQAQKQLEFWKNYIRPMSHRFQIHLTPDFSLLHLANGKDSYKYNNKPFGLRHWMEQSLGMGISLNSSFDDDIVILMDPDMILLRPIGHDFTHDDVIWVEDHVPDEMKVVWHGHPIAQQDGYLSNHWMKLPLNLSCPPQSEGPLHWNSGPPYLATARDMYAIAVRWTKWAPRVLKVYPATFAEMYGFIYATLELNLPFTFLKSLVVSTTESSAREGWEYVDKLPLQQLCADPPLAPLPVGLHYCQRYSLGKSFFSKYRIKKNIMQCDKSLLTPVPSDVLPKYNYSITPPRADRSDAKTYREIREYMEGKQAKREAFMLCQLTYGMNAALRYHKKLACANGKANLNETYSVHDDPTDW